MSARTLEKRLNTIEERGTVQVQLNTKDISWIREYMDDMRDDLKCIRQLLAKGAE